MIANDLNKIILSAVRKSPEGVYYSALQRMVKSAGLTANDCRQSVDSLIRSGMLKHRPAGLQVLIMTPGQARAGGDV